MEGDYHMFPIQNCWLFCSRACTKHAILGLDRVSPPPECSPTFIEWMNTTWQSPITWNSDASITNHMKFKCIIEEKKSWFPVKTGHMSGTWICSLIHFCCTEILELRNNSHQLPRIPRVSSCCTWKQVRLHLLVVRKEKDNHQSTRINTAHTHHCFVVWSVPRKGNPASCEFEQPKYPVCIWFSTDETLWVKFTLCGPSISH